MQSHLTLLLSLSLTLSVLLTATNAATPTEAALGKIPGFLNSWNLHPRHPRSDHLSATSCYCHLPDGLHIPARTEEAHIFQYEYYNVHSNTTYIVDDVCQDTLDSTHQSCLENRNVDHAVHGDKVCRRWRRDPNNGKGGHDRFCYAAADVDNGRGEDAVVFNGQRRELGGTGGQGPLKLSGDVVEEACGGLCSAFAGLSLFRDEKLAPNRIVVFEDLDDMCPRCK